VRFAQGQTTVYEFPFDSQSAVRCNWLAQESGDPLPGFIISPPLAYGLAGYLRPEQTYEVQITFSQLPPAGSSVWYSWSRPDKHLKKE
jgi:hypothetical protein